MMMLPTWWWLANWVWVRRQRRRRGESRGRASSARGPVGGKGSSSTSFMFCHNCWILSSMRNSHQVKVVASGCLEDDLVWNVGHQHRPRLSQSIWWNKKNAVCLFLGPATEDKPFLWLFISFRLNSNNKNADWWHCVLIFLCICICIFATLMYMMRTSLMTLTRGRPGAMNNPIHTVPCSILCQIYIWYLLNIV